ncbi:MAG: CPBP family intramembrane glutamic endopeptidase [Candidatus Eremiobacteraeota bacterium]|nr:CPBP family intramembrane glutamic endopeptidase [Candidatus Eremiobacteraeota bacterium]
MKEIARRYPLPAFFLTAFACSWIVWLCLLFFPVKNTSHLLLISVIGAFGPAIAAIVISSILNNGSSGIPLVKRWGFFALLVCVIFPFAAWWPLLKGDPKDPLFLLLCAILSVLSAFVISGVLARNAGVQDMMASLGAWRICPVWYLIALFSWPLLLIGSSLLDKIFGARLLTPYFAELASIKPLSAVILYITIFLLGGPLQEEPGWRGFGLPRLQARYNPIVASIILGFFWQLWHIPLYFIGFYPFDTVQIALRFVEFLPGVIVFTWLYNRSGGNLLIAVVFHASIDAFPQILPAQSGRGPMFFDLLILIWAVTVIITDRMWERRHAAG